MSATLYDMLRQLNGQQPVAGTNMTLYQLLGGQDLTPGLSQSLTQPSLAAPTPVPQAPMPPGPTRPMPKPIQMQAPLDATPQAPVQAPPTGISGFLSNPNSARMLLSMGAALMDAGGPSTKQTSLGQALARGAEAGMQAQDEGNAIDAQRQAQQQALKANQWTTLTPEQARKVIPGGLAPGFSLQQNGNGEYRQIGGDVIKSGTDPYTGLPTLQDIRKIGSGTGTTANPQQSRIDATVDLVGKYQEPLATALARTPWAIRGMVQQQLAQKYPNYQAENYSMYNKGYKDFGTGQQGNTVRSMNVGISHLDTLGQLADALHNGDIPLINKISNYWKTQTGQAAPSNFDSAKNVVAQELVKAITGYPGAASDREAAAAEIKNDSSPQALKGTIETYQKLLAGQLMGLKGQYQHSTGRDDFEQALKLNPEVIQKLEGADTGNSSAPAATGATAAAPVRWVYDPATGTMKPQ